MPNCSGCGEWLSLYDGLALAHSQNQCVANLRQRIEELESKLGAASVIGSKAQASEATARRQEAGAAPSVSVQRWFGKGLLFSGLGDRDAARACDLAAAVTEWAKSPSWGVEKDNDQLRDIALAFVRGEPLPQKGG